MSNPARVMRWVRGFAMKPEYTDIPIYSDFDGNPISLTLPSGFQLPMQSQTVDGVEYNWAFGNWSSNPPNTKVLPNTISIAPVTSVNYYYVAGIYNFVRFEQFYRPRWYLNSNQMYGFNADIGSSSDSLHGVLALDATVNGIHGVIFTGQFPKATGQDYGLLGNYHSIWFLSDSFFNGAEVRDYNNNGGAVGGGGGNGLGVPVGDGVLPDIAKPSIFPNGYGIHLYNISQSDYGALCDILWGRSASAFQSGGFWERWKNYKFNPISGAMSVHHVPAELTPTIGDATPIKIAGIDLPDIQPYAITSQWSSRTFDAVEFPEPIGYFGDYAGVSAKITLPFCGVVGVPASAFMGGSLQVKYWCDVVNGNVAAAVTATDRRGVTQIVAEATGNCAYVIPVTGNDNGMSEIVGTFKGMVNSALSANPMGLASAGINLALGTEQHHTQISGSLTGNVGYAATQKIICTIEFPVNIQSAREYNAINGRPSHYASTIGDFTGYCEFIIDGVEIDGATAEEKAEIVSALRSGVFV